MPDTILHFAAVVVGLGILAWSADHFVDGAAAIAKHLGVSTLIIGITIIGFGTSAPEIIVSIIAVLEDTPGLAIGNALGSNIANIGLILGFTALLAHIPIAERLLKTEFPLLLFATAVMIACLYDLDMSRIEGIILLALLAAILYYLVRQHRSHPAEYSHEDEEHGEQVHEMSIGAALGWLLFGLLLLVGSSRLLVWGASSIATTFGVSDLIIGLTIVALGTSLPELAASISSLKKGEPDLAIGNVVGSNLFNSLAVVGTPALFSGFAVESSALYRDIPVVVALTLGLFLISRFPLSGPKKLSRVHGVLLLGSFVFYQLYLYYEVAF